MPEKNARAAAEPKPWVPKGPVYRRLLTEKFVAETEREKVLTSVIVAMAENIDGIVAAIGVLRLQDVEFGETLQQVAEQVLGGVLSTSRPQPEPQTEDAAEPVAEGHPPFPADAVPTVVNAGTGPLPDEADAPIPKPNQPQVKANAAPIPKPPSNEPKAARNGQKA